MCKAALIICVFFSCVDYRRLLRWGTHTAAELAAADHANATVQLGDADLTDRPRLLRWGISTTVDLEAAVDANARAQLDPVGIASLAIDKTIPDKVIGRPATKLASRCGFKLTMYIERRLQQRLAKHICALGVTSSYPHDARGANCRQMILTRYFACIEAWTSSQPCGRFFGICNKTPAESNNSMWHDILPFLGAAHRPIMSAMQTHHLDNIPNTSSRERPRWRSCAYATINLVCAPCL